MADKLSNSLSDAIAEINNSTDFTKQKRFSKTISPNGKYTITMNEAGPFLVIIQGSANNIERGIILQGYIVNQWCCYNASTPILDYGYNTNSNLISWARNANKIEITNGTSLDVLIQVIVIAMKLSSVSAT